eukprot:m.668999 g.668999  ORF g.668999 m.668999 type:complete len:95 (+) comp58519_c0_seq48:45-329(+)
MPQMSAEGEGLFTGGTRRADGSYRKVVRVRPGYVPQEEVPKYVPEQRRVRDAPPTHHFTIVSSASRATESSVSLHPILCFLHPSLAITISSAIS